MTGKTPVQQFEDAKKRLETLRTRVTRAQTMLEAETKKRDDALAEALVEYEVDNLADLKKLLAEREASNQAKRDAFVAAVDTAETQLKAVEAQLAS